MKVVTLTSLLFATAVLHSCKPIHALLEELFLSSESSVSCTVSELFGLAPPGSPHIDTKHYSCTTDDGIPLFFDDDASALLGSSFVPGSTRLALTASAISADNHITVQQAIAAPGAVSVIHQQDMPEHDNSARRLTQTGTKRVLVVRVVSASYAPSQSEAQLYDDIFTDENNLRARYIECSNNQLTFDPATGAGVNNGILTVTTTTELNGLIWTSCGDIAISGAAGISRDFTMVICPDVVNFQGAAAWGQMPGSITWYLSSYASVPIVQVHEVGHNLGHPHSGRFETYDDPTCNMGNQGSWSDTGSAFCFNGVKTWTNGWHSSFYRSINPNTASYDGSLYGINAVNANRITTSEDVVWRVYTSGAGAYIYIMFNRAAGPNNGVPGSGDQVIVHSHAGRWYDDSFIVGSLSQGQTYTYSNWISSQALIVSVCSITLGDPGVARVLVYTSANPLSCNVSTPSPTKAVTAAPTKSPVIAPDENLCQDSSELFNYRNKKKTCFFIAKKNTQKRCTFSGVADACPVTCQVGCQCFETEGRFDRGNNKTSTCAWVARKNTDKRCRNNAIRSNCPITCGVCSA